jgi:hypothetical protein
MITTDSRYNLAPVVRVTEQDTTRLVIINDPPGVETFNFTYYKWQDGDRIDRVAEDYFDDGVLWYVIADANPEILVWTRFDIPVGTTIRIPSA